MSKSGPKTLLLQRLALAGLALWGATGCLGRPVLEVGDSQELQQAETVSFATLTRQILGPACLRCHAGASADAGIDLTNFKSLTDPDFFPVLVVPGKPEESALYTAVESGFMPYEENPLPEAAIAYLRDWIRAGAARGPRPRPKPPTGPGPVAEPGEITPEPSDGNGNDNGNGNGIGGNSAGP